MDLLSQINGAVVILIFAILIFAIIKFIKYKKELLSAANQWRESENEKEAHEQQVVDNTASIEELKQLHIQDMQAIADQQTERFNQSITIREEFFNRLESYQNETRNSMNQIIDTVNKIESDALCREIDQIRYKIIRFSKELRYGDQKSQDEYNHIFQSIDKYHTLLERTNTENGQIDIESKFIRSQYLTHLEHRDIVE